MVTFTVGIHSMKDLFHDVCYHNNPQSTFSPQECHDFLNDAIDPEHLQNCCFLSTSSDPSCVKINQDLQCMHCRQLCAISAIKSVFDYCNRNCKTMMEDQNNRKDLHFKDFHENSPQPTTADHMLSSTAFNEDALTNSVVASTKVVNQEQNGESATHCTSDITTWYHQMLVVLLSKDVAGTLIACLKSKCPYTSHLARKTLLLGIQGKYIKIHEVLTAHGNDEVQDKAVFVVISGFCKSLLSLETNVDQIPQQIFEWMAKLDLSKLMPQMNEAKTIFLETKGLLEFLWLIKTLLKSPSSCLQYFSEINGKSVYCFILENLLPASHAFFSVQRKENGHILCSKFLNIFSYVMKIELLEQRKLQPPTVHNIAFDFLKHSSSFFQLAWENNLLQYVNFVGSSLEPGVSCSSLPVSALTKHLIAAVLRACVVLLGDNCETKELKIVLKAMNSMMYDVRLLFESVPSLQPMQWLSHIFGDQDDQWINALLCSLVIYIHMKRRQDDATVQMVSKAADQIEMHSNSPCESACGTSVQTVLYQQQDLTNTSHEKTGTGPCTTSAVLNCSTKLVISEELISFMCPHSQFLQFAKIISLDHFVITDFLTSPETHFLTYFTKYLHFLCEDWSNFNIVCMNFSFFHENCSDGQNVSKIFVRHHGQTREDNPLLGAQEPNILNETVSDNNITELKNVFLPCKRQLGKSHLSTESRQTDFRKKLRNSQMAEQNAMQSEVAPSLQNEKLPHVNSLVTYSDSDTEGSDLESLPASVPVESRLSSSHSSHEMSDDESEVTAILSDRTQSEINTVIKQNDFALELETKTHHVRSGLEDVMSMLIHLRFHIEKLNSVKLFPYNAGPLLSLLNKCEHIYENTS